jgi:SAM-dependent methyltransferase
MTPGPDPELERIAGAYRERDRAAGTQRSLAEPASLLHRHELEWQVLAALRRAGVEAGRAALLDLGSGDGALLARIAELGFTRTAGIELVAERQARARARGLDVRVGSASELPFGDGEFDVVTQFTVLSSVLDPETRARIAAEALRVLRPGGVILSYDLRRAPAVLRAARRVLLGAGRDRATPTAPPDPSELERFWGRRERSRPVQLNLELAEALRGRRALVAAARALPPLRSHVLATYRKP